MRSSDLSRAVVAVALVGLLALPAGADTRYWDGGGADRYWEIVDNWDGDTTLPGPTDDIVFLSTAARNNPWNNTTGRTCNSLTFEDNGGIWSLSGQEVTVTSGSLVCEGGTWFSTGNIVLPTGGVWQLDVDSANIDRIKANGHAVTVNGRAELTLDRVGHNVSNLTINNAGVTVAWYGIMGIGTMTLGGDGNTYLRFGSSTTTTSYDFEIALDPGTGGNRQIYTYAGNILNGDVTGCLGPGGELRLGAAGNYALQMRGTLSMDAPGGVVITGGRVFLRQANTYDDPTIVRGKLAPENTAGSATGEGPVIIEAGGQLLCAGIIDPADGNDVTVHGYFWPGRNERDALTMTIGSPGSENDLNLADGSTLRTDLQLSGQCDQVYIHGDLNIAENATLYAYANRLNGDYTVIEYTGTRTGTFDHVPTVHNYLVRYHDEVKRVELRRRIPGDCDLDWDVDFSDYVKTKGNFGKTGTVWADGDFDEDGDVDFKDYVACKGNFGIGVSGEPVPPFQDVPEPAALGLLALGALAILRRRPRR